MTSSLRVLLTDIVDYAGLFPPTKLSLQDAISNYLNYHQAPEHWMLGHFVIPVTQLQGLETCLANSSAINTLIASCSLSAILSENWEPELEQIQAFNHRYQLQIAALEFKPLTPRDIKRAICYLPNEIESFFEISLDKNLESYLEVLAGTKASAKIRTGGLTAEIFPDEERLVKFIFASAEVQVPFKATAGLHHILAGKYSLCYQDKKFIANMQGFLNLSILAALVYWQKLTRLEALNVLQESSITNFKFQEENINWKTHHLNLAELKKSRQYFFRSFGSCSFQEPLDELRGLQLL